MAQIRVPLVTGAGGFQARVPTFAEVPGSYQGDPSVISANGIRPGVAPGNPLLNNVTVLVEVPDEDVTNGALDAAKIKARYPNHFLVTGGIIK